MRSIVGKPIYDHRQWVLCLCTACGAANYVEPHGTTAACKCATEWTEHQNIPQEWRDVSGTRVIIDPRQR